MHSCQVDSVGLDDLQEGNVAAADSSFNQVQGTPLSNPTTALNAALTAGRPLSALSPGASLSTIQNSAVVSFLPYIQSSTTKYHFPGKKLCTL